MKGIHVAERDTQRAKEPKPFDTFWNTWSVEGFIAEGLQPAELGWGSHENWKPKMPASRRRATRQQSFLSNPAAAPAFAHGVRRMARSLDCS